MSQKEPVSSGQEPSFMLSSSVVQAISAHAYAISRASPEATSEPSVLSVLTVPSQPPALPALPTAPIAAATTADQEAPATEDA
jgi:hypothetical protein